MNRIVASALSQRPLVLLACPCWSGSVFTH